MTKFDYEFSDACFEQYASLIHQETGITLDTNRKTMLSGRLKKRLMHLSLTSYKDYFHYLIENKKEKNTFINLVTTNETYFYRTPRVWDYFTNRFLLNIAPDKTLNIWSAAASTGEEAYTLGVICEQYKVEHPTFSYRILGTDISSDVIDTSNRGCYNGRSIKRFKEAKLSLFNEHMQGNDTIGYSVTSNIKKNITFKTHNVFLPLEQPQIFDIIFLRNILIYFTKEDQKKLLLHIQQYLRPNGLLIIGESESIARLETQFQLLEPLIYSLDINHEKAA